RNQLFTLLLKLYVWTVAVIGLEVNGDPMIQKSKVLLRCGDQFEGTEIHWQKNGMTIPDQGNNITIAIYGMLGGNYTCHNPSGELLNHTLVLVKPVDFEKAILTATDKEFITCVARNYSGPFHCFWKWDSKRNGVVVFVKASRNSQLMNCSLDVDNNGLTCEEQQCPSSEEVNRISLTLMVRSQYRLEEHQKTFFIHDISKSFQCPLLDSAVMSSLFSDYPIIPHYTNLTQYKVNSRKSYTFCVRAQDSLTNQVWSEWSEEK
uniref:Interleukin 12B, b n=1 Tax=Astyanax mexicanus TaxID=7994 RepID=A0A8B9H9G5_ASTMX